MKTSDPYCLAPVGDHCGEGAVWAANEAAVFWTDINRFLIHRLDYVSLSVQSWLFDEPVVALSLSDVPGKLLVALGSRLIWWWPETDHRAEHGFRLPGWPAVRLNDGRADPLGNFWVGSMRNNVLPNGEPGEAGGTDGILYRIAADGSITEWARGIAIANTLCWSPDGTRFYTADTWTNDIYVYDFDDTNGTIANRANLLHGYARGLPDGSAIDSEGYLWNCRFFGGGILRIAPDGEIDRFIEMPVRNITTCTFGGPDLSTLLITSASVERATGDRLAGSLWAIDTDVRGLPENRVKSRGRTPG